MFTGAHRVRVDDKGRMAIPASFRKQLREGSFVSIGQDNVLGAGVRAPEPAAWTGSPGAVAHPLSTIGSVRARRPGTDQPAPGATAPGRDRDPVDGRGDRRRLEGGNLARGAMGQLQRRRTRTVHRIR
ncbi:MAG: hypothetical protein E6J28_04800 [Chloroflexi bacterium]|nr:MAG: hypothetical protein E6J28_04800 [Chloroflexota bacterium]